MCLTRAEQSGLNHYGSCAGAPCGVHGLGARGVPAAPGDAKGTTAPMVPRGRAEAGSAGGAGPRRAHGRPQVRGAGGHGQRGGAAAGLGGAHHQGRLGLLRQVRTAAGRTRWQRSERPGAASAEQPRVRGRSRPSRTSRGAGVAGPGRG